MKGILGFFLIVLGAYGLFYWHHTLWSSGGPDIGRSSLQYITPYFITCSILFIGLRQCVKSFFHKVKH